MADKVIETLKMRGYMHSEMPASLVVRSVQSFPVDTSVLIAYIAGLFAVRRWRLEKASEEGIAVKDAETYLEGFIRSISRDLGISDKEVDDVKHSIEKYEDVITAFNDVGPILRATVPVKSQTDSIDPQKYIPLAFAYVNDGATIARFGNLSSADLRELVEGLSYFVGLSEREQKVLNSTLFGS